VRKPIVAGNWKMNNTFAEATALTASHREKLDGVDAVEIVLCPPSTALEATGRALVGSAIRLGAQNVHDESSGAFTGEVSTTMLCELGCRYVIVGHSERRTLFHETDEGVWRKTRAVIEAGMTPIVCVGETLAEREGGRTEDVLRRQLDGGLRDLAEATERIVLAYEPVWAIGTGRSATPEMAQQAHAFIRERARASAGDAIADGLRIQYGGSVKADNAAELFSQPDIDGGLIGGASLDASGFATIVEAACAKAAREA